VARVFYEHPIYTKYYSGNYEKKVSGSSAKEFHYIFGGDGLAAVYIKENGAGQTASALGCLKIITKNTKTTHFQQPH
jgi:hypothetical protein